VWDLDDCREIRTLEGHTAAVTSVGVSVDGQWIASGSEDKTLKIWELTTGRSKTISAHEGAVTAVAFVPGHSAIVSGGGDRTIRLWNTDSEVPLSTLTLDSPVRSCAVGPGLTVMAGDASGGVHFLRIDGLDRN